jgi:hypothetical protein
MYYMAYFYEYIHPSNKVTNYPSYMVRMVLLTLTIFNDFLFYFLLVTSKFHVCGWCALLSAAPIPPHSLTLSDL